MINIYVLLEWCITSSLLILAVIAIRILTKNKISPLLRYGLWLVVLVRLLIHIVGAQAMYYLYDFLIRPSRSRYAPR